MSWVPGRYQEERGGEGYRDRYRGEVERDKEGPKQDVADLLHVVQLLLKVEMWVVRCKSPVVIQACVDCLSVGEPAHKNEQALNCFNDEDK